MQLVNKTKWRSEDLRKILLAAARLAGVSTRGWKFSVSYSKSSIARPYYWPTGTNRGKVVIPSPAKAWPTVVEKVAAVETGSAPAAVIESIVRAAGCSFGHGMPVIVPPSVEGLVLREEEKKPGKGRLAGPALQRIKINALFDKLAKWTPKLKRAQAAVKRIEREIKRRQALLKKLEQGGEAA